MTDFNAPNYSTPAQGPADPLAGFHGPTSKERDGRGGEGDGREGEGVGEEREGDVRFFPEPTCQP